MNDSLHAHRCKQCLGMAKSGIMLQTRRQVNQMNNPKPSNKVTCALALIDNCNRLVIVHPTNAPYLGAWSLPKGLPDEQEAFVDAAARECFEETGIDVRDMTAHFIDCGRHTYTKGKDLQLFLYRSKALVNASELTCSSLVTSANGKTFPECDKFQVLTFDELGPFLNKKQLNIVQGTLQALC